MCLPVQFERPADGGANEGLPHVGFALTLSLKISRLRPQFAKPSLRQTIAQNQMAQCKVRPSEVLQPPLGPIPVSGLVEGLGSNRCAGARGKGDSRHSPILAVGLMAVLGR